MNRYRQPRRVRGFTLAEVLTALVVVVVLAAVAIPMWRNHLLRVRRADAISALIKVQAAQDKFFGRNARYAGAAAFSTPAPEGLGLASQSEHGFYRIEIRTSNDALEYTAIARVRSGDSDDARCAQLSIDHLGIRRAVDSAGADRSSDCWR